MIQIVLSFILGVISKMLGGFDPLLNMLLMLIVMDYITGIMKAIVNKKLSSEIGYKGIFKKILILFMVAISNEIDLLFNEVGIRFIVITFYIVNESISIIENSATLGLPIPKKIKSTLNIIKKQENNNA